MQRLAYHIATVLGLGDRLPAPGTTAGSLPATIGWWLAMTVLDDPVSRIAATLLGAAVVAAVGVWAAAVEGARRGVGDPGPVVIDEVAGQWLSLLPAAVLNEPGTPLGLGFAALGGFIAFRFFDVVKPWPVRRFEALPGGVGVMADDLAAGALAAVVLSAVLLVV